MSLHDDNPAAEGSLWGDGIIPKRGMFVIHTGAKRGKSMLTVNISIALAAGAPTFLDIPLYGPGSSVIFQREVTRAEMNSRTRKMLVNAPFTINPEVLRRVFHNKGRALRLSDPTVFNELRAYLRDVRPALVWLDPFAHVGTENENDNAEVGKVLERLAVLRDDPGCALGIVHHDRKTSEATRGVPPSQNARGADRLIADADAVISLTQAGKHPRGPASRFHVISRYGPSPEPFSAVFNGQTFWWERTVEKGEVMQLAAWVKEAGGELGTRALLERVNTQWNLKDPQNRRSGEYVNKAVAAGVLHREMTKGKAVYYLKKREA